MSDASRISDLDLRGYRGEKPGWFVQRICCMSLAAEIRRMTLDLEPAFDGAWISWFLSISRGVVGKSLLWAMPGSEILAMRLPCVRQMITKGAKLLSQLNFAGSELTAG